MTETGSAPRSDWRAMISLYAAMMAVGMGQSVVFAVLPMLGRELALHEMLWQLPSDARYATVWAQVLHRRRFPGGSACSSTRRTWRKWRH